MFRVLGEALRLVEDKILIVKLKTGKPPPLKCEVYTPTLSKVGFIADIIGSVGEPYAVVKLINPEFLIKEFRPHLTLYFKLRVRKGKAGEGRLHGRTRR